MKKFVLFGIIVTFFSLFFISCNNIADTSSYLNNMNQRKLVTITVSSDNYNLSNNTVNSVENTLDRTITPVAVQNTDLNFYIGGKDILYNQKLPVQKVNFSPSADTPNLGSISFELETSCYSLTLIAVEKTVDDITLTSTTTIESLKSKSILYSNALVDLVYCESTSSIAFNLSPTGLSDKGKYNFKLYLKDWSPESLASQRGDSVVQTIFKVDTGIYKNGVLQGDSTVPLSFTDKQSLDTAYTYTGELQAGNYELILSFNKDNNLFLYKEDFVILAGQTTTSNFAIPDLIMNAPSAPTNFKQGYIKPENPDADYYYVLFTWTDNSNTEDGFEIQIQDENDNTINVTPSTPINDSSWDTQAASKTITYSSKDSATTTEFVNSGSWFAGNLDKNSTWAAFYMPLGKRYIARIRAVNDAGGSKWCYATSAATTATIPGGSATAENSNLQYSKDLNATAFNTPIINLYRIKYNLNGGTFSPTVSKIYYADQTTTGTSIMVPDGVNTNPNYNSGNPITLKKGTDYLWNKWKIGNIAGPEFDTANTYKDFENLNLYASYIDISVPDSPIDYSLDANLSFTASTIGTGTQPSLSIVSNTINVTKSTADYTANILNLTFTYTTEIRYSTFKLELYNSNGDDVGTFTVNGTPISVPLSILDTGTYTGKFKAYIPSKPATPFEKTFTIIVQ